MGYTVGEGRARIWIATYQVRYIPMGPGAEGRAEAEARRLALADVPDAAIEIRRVRNTSPGRFSVTMKRTRPGA